MRTLFQLGLFVMLVTGSLPAGEALVGEGTPNPPASPAPSLTLAEAIQTGLARHPRLQQARSRLSAAQAQIDQTRAAFFPQVSASGLAKQGLSGASSSALGLRGLVASPLYRDLASSALVTQNLFDSGRIKHAKRAKEWAYEAWRHNLEAEEKDIVLGVEVAYLGALQRQRILNVAEKAVAARELTVRQARSFYRAELKSKVDMTLAEVNLSKAELERTRARHELAEAFSELNHAMGIVGPARYILEEPKVAPEMPPDLGVLAAEALRNRPELQALDSQIKAHEETLAQARSQFGPRLAAIWSGGFARFPQYSLGRLMVGALGFDWPIFTGGYLKGQVEEARAHLASAQGARREREQAIRLETTRAYYRVLGAMDEVKTSSQLIAQAREGERLAKVRYRVQMGDFLELATAELELANAESVAAQALYKYYLAEAALRAALGRQK